MLQEFVSKYPEAATAAVKAGGTPAPKKRTIGDVKGKGGKGRVIMKRLKKA